MNVPRFPNKSSLEKCGESVLNHVRLNKRFKTMNPSHNTTHAVAKQREVHEVDYLKKMLTGTSKELEHTEIELHRIRDEFHKYREKESERDNVGDLNILHNQLNSAVSNIEKSTQKLLKTQEKELINFFNAKLNDLKIQFQAEKEAKFKEILEMNLQGCEAANELNTLRITVHFIEDQNTKLISKNRSLKSSLIQAKDELNFLAQRYSKFKQEKLYRSHELEKIALSLPNTPKNTLLNCSPILTGMAFNLEDPKLRRNELYIKNLQKSLDIEREHLKKLRMLYNQEVGDTNELKTHMKECILQVRSDMNSLKKDKRSDSDDVKSLIVQMSCKEDLFRSILESLNQRRMVMS